MAIGFEPAPVISPEENALAIKRNDLAAIVREKEGIERRLEGAKRDGDEKEVKRLTGRLNDVKAALGESATEAREPRTAGTRK